MTDTTIFTDDKSTTQEPNTPAGSTQAPAQTDNSLVAALVGEGKKYKSVDELAKAYINADTFIDNLKQENALLREKATAAKTIDEVLESLQKGRNEPSTDPSKKQDAGVSVTDITKIVEQTLERSVAQKAAEANLKKADEKMKVLFGDKAAQVYKEAATSPEVHEAYMKLAATDPDKFVSLFAPQTTPVGQMDRSTLNTSALNLQTGDRASMVGTKEYFDKVRREKPSEYYSQEFQLVMDKAVRANPDLYYGRR